MRFCLPWARRRSSCDITLYVHKTVVCTASRARGFLAQLKIRFYGCFKGRFCGRWRPRGTMLTWACRKRQILRCYCKRTMAPKKSLAKNNTNLESSSWFVLFLYGAVEGTRTLKVSHRNLNPTRLPISPRLQATSLYHTQAICKVNSFEAFWKNARKTLKNGCFSRDCLIYCISLAGVTQW